MPPSSRRRSRRNPRPRPEAILLATRNRRLVSPRTTPEALLLRTAHLGLAAPRSTCESIGAETPDRSASPRGERPIASRSAFTRGPTAAMVGSTAAAITLVRYHVRQLRQWLSTASSSP